MSRFSRHPGALAGVVLVALFTVLATVGPFLVAHDPLAQDLANNFAPPGWRHLLGTDDLGRDAWARVVYGARISLGVSLASVAGGLLMGAVVGFAAGFYGGWLDRVTMRVMDVLLAFPGILLAIVIVAVLGRGIDNTIAAVALFAVPTFARLARGSALSVVSLEYVSAAQALGAGDAWIVVRHLVPNALSPLLVQATLMMGTAILTAAGLSFLGLGVQPPDPEWGAMLSKGRELVRVAPMVAVAPGIAITLVVLGFSLTGDGLRDALDPKQAGR